VAREVVERLIDDLDGSEATETLTFGLDGATYEIDLSKKNSAALCKALEPFAKVGRKARSAGGRRKAAPTVASPKVQRDYDIIHLREWAGSNGVAIPARGRIPQAVVEQYKKAGGR
jgi:hypothetical protein